MFVAPDDTIKGVIIDWLSRNLEIDAPDIANIILMNVIKCDYPVDNEHHLFINMGKSASLLANSFLLVLKKRGY